MRLSNQNAHVYINLNMGSKFLFHFIHILESKVFFYIHIILFLGIKYQAWNVYMNKPLNKTFRIYMGIKQTVVSCVTRVLIFCLNMQIGLSNK